MKLMKRVLLSMLVYSLFFQIPLMSQNKINKSFLSNNSKQGETWAWQSMGNVLGDANLEQILIDPEDNAIWYVTSIEKGLYITWDSGANWTHVIDARGLDPEALQIDPNNPKNVYAGVWDKLYKSEDKGKTWNIIYNCPEYIRSVLVSKKDSSIYLGPQTETNSSPGIYKSTDGGQHFNTLPFGVSTQNLLCWDIVEDTVNNILYIPIEQADHPQPYNPPLFRSFDGGNSWDNIGTIGWHAQKMAVDNTNGFVYFLKEGGGLYRSLNFGLTWKLLNSQYMMYFIFDPAHHNRMFGADYQDYGAKCAWMSENTGHAFASLGLAGLKVTSINMNGDGTKLYASTWGNGLWTADVPEYVPFSGLRVANTNDAGLWSLREAVNLANRGIGPDTIRFDIPKTDPGYDASSGTWTIVSTTEMINVSEDSLFIDGNSQQENIGEDTNTKGPEIVLTAADSIHYGIYISSAYNHISHLIVNGIIGTGISVTGQSADHNIITGCYLGTDGSGEISRPNQFGIYLNNSRDNQIGSLNAGDRNILSGNSNHGIVLSGQSCSNNLIIGNDIGLTPTEQKRGNGSYGVFIGGNASDNVIMENEIAFNGSMGITVWDEGSDQNTISKNSIYGNLAGGILIYTGANGDLQPPVLNVNGGIISGVTVPDVNVELFSDDAGQGEKYEGSVIANAAGNFEWTEKTDGPFVTATATDGSGNTSTFSNPVSAPSNGETKNIIVTTTSETGEGSITEALQAAQNNTGKKIIKFNIPESDAGFDAGTGTWTINTTQEFYITTDSLTIDGRSQKVFIGEDSNPVGPEIIFNETSNNSFTCFATQSVDEFNVYNLIFSGYASGVALNTVNGGYISGCYFNTDPSGIDSLGNAIYSVYMVYSSDITIGVSDSSTGNLCFGSSDSELYVDNCSNISIIGNVLGVNRTKERSFSSTFGAIVIWTSENIEVALNTVGGSGVGLSSYQNSQLTVRDNLFNVTRTWEKIGNLQVGVWLTEASYDNFVKDNIIGFCQLYAIGLQDGAVRNRLSRNLLTGKDCTGIYLGPGTNDDITAPTILSASPSKVTGQAGAGNIIEIFNDDNSQAREYLGITTADGSGNFSMSFSAVPTLANITATATDADSNTSALSAPMKISETGVVDDVLSTVKSFYLAKNYPNPFNPSTTICFGLEKSGFADLQVYNMRGERVANLLHKNMSAGQHKVTLNGTSLPSGVYIVRLHSGKFEQMQKIMLVR